MLDALRADPRLAHQFLLLAHLYARADGWALAWLRLQLQRPRFTPAHAAGAGAGAAALALGATAAARSPAFANALWAPLEAAWDSAEQAFPPLQRSPKLVVAGAATLALGGAWLYRRGRRGAALARAAALQAAVRVNRPQPAAVVAALLDSLFDREVSVIEGGG